jgi:hypothetical protein
VERELSRVREEIERLQGRLRVLGDLSAMSTITITVNEVKPFVTPGGTQFSAQIGRTFSDSLAAMRAMGEALVLLLVAVAPWLVLPALLGLMLWWMIRRNRSARPLPDGPRPEQG